MSMKYLFFINECEANTNWEKKKKFQGKKRVIIAFWPPMFPHSVKFGNVELHKLQNRRSRWCLRLQPFPLCCKLTEAKVEKERKITGKQGSSCTPRAFHPLSSTGAWPAIDREIKSEEKRKLSPIESSKFRLENSFFLYSRRHKRKIEFIDIIRSDDTHRGRWPSLALTRSHITHVPPSLSLSALASGFPFDSWNHGKRKKC